MSSYNFNTVAHWMIMYIYTKQHATEEFRLVLMDAHDLAIEYMIYGLAIDHIFFVLSSRNEQFCLK